MHPLSTICILKCLNILKTKRGALSDILCSAQEVSRKKYYLLWPVQKYTISSAPNSFSRDISFYVFYIEHTKYIFDAKIL
jgi:hypothetical protein